MIKAIIFDMDGLMIDSEDHYSVVMQEIASEYGKTYTSDVKKLCMGRTPIESMKAFAIALNISQSPEKLLEQRTGLMRKHMQEQVQLMPGLPVLLQKYKGKLKMAVATGSQREFLDIILKKYDLTQYFDVCLSAEDVSCGKPNPEIYLKTVKALSLQPEECVVLEDAQNGVVAAKAAGCKVIAVPNKWTVTSNFSCADHICNTLIQTQNHILETEDMPKNDNIS